MCAKKIIPFTKMIKNEKSGMLQYKYKLLDAFTLNNVKQ